MGQKAKNKQLNLHKTWANSFFGPRSDFIIPKARWGRKAHANIRTKIRLWPRC